MFRYECVLLCLVLGFDHFGCSFGSETVTFVFGLVQVAATRAAAEDAYYSVKKGRVFPLLILFTFFVVLVLDHREAFLTEKFDRGKL